MIDEVAWSVSPKNLGMNRPRRLVEELISLGAIDGQSSYFHHGRSRSTDLSENAGVIFPGLEFVNPERAAILSPVFQYDFSARPKWIDFYDDWSIAPDINPISRVLSKISYAKAAASPSSATTITVNSQYMAAKLRLPLHSVVENGVDANLSRVVRSGDDRNRVIILGKLFKGRTDERLVDEVSRLPWIDEVLFCGLGDDKEINALVGRLAADLGSKIQTRSWVDPVSFGEICGDRTFALIPHIVSDYTLSQNLMKAYLLTSLGVPIVCPSLLWPSNLDKEHAFLINAGVNLDRNLRQWNERVRAGEDWRRNFVEENSWASRALLIAERLA